MYPCNRGEMLTRSVHENAANRTVAMRTRTQVCERPELFIGSEACDNRGIRASKFLMVELRTHQSEQLSFGTQHHDLFLTLRERGPFPPILCSRNTGPDLTGPGSNGDVQNDASIPESSRDQTPVLSP